MPINMVGNVNGSYRAPKLDLFELARKQGNTPELFQHQGQPAGAEGSVKVHISKEGLRALHATELKGSIDLQKQEEELKYISEHQPVENYWNRLQKALQESVDQAVAAGRDQREIKAQEKGDAVLSAFKGMVDEVVDGYANGTRVRFVEDPAFEDGYRRLTPKEELFILQKEFEEFVGAKFTKKQPSQNIPANLAAALRNAGREYLAAAQACASDGNML